MTGQTLFISHSSEDAEAVGKIVDYLERHGVACWISSRDIPPKAIYAEAITQAMSTAQACAVIASKSSNESDAIKRELELASRYKKPFIPIRIDATEPGPGLDYYLNNTQWMDFRRDGEKALDRIVAHMTGASAPAAAPRAARAEEPSPRKGGGGLMIVLVSVLVLALVGGGGYWFWNQQQLAASAQKAEAEKLALSAPSAPIAEPSVAESPAVEAAPAEAAKEAVQPVFAGKWTGTYTMNNTPYPLTFVFHEDGTYEQLFAGNAKGKWQEADGLYTWSGCDAPNCMRWEGRFEGDAVMTGKQNLGTFEMKRN